jgi:protein DJ-1
MTSGSKTAVVLIADGSEEMEAVITIDVLRRAGIDVTVVSVGNQETVKCSRGVNIVADSKLSSLPADKADFDAVILPGGLNGAKAFCDSDSVGQLLKRHEDCNRLIAAICAAPTALKQHQLGLGKTLTSYPSFQEQLSKDYNYSEERVVQDGNWITSRGPGTAFEFALKIVQHLLGEDKMKETLKPLLLK